MKSNKKFMLIAIQEAEKALLLGYKPFGACVVKNEEVISSSYNLVKQEFDITAHAEVEAVKKACKKLNTLNLEDCELYTTCEPCLMCLGLCFWAKISTLYYGMNINDAIKCDLRQLNISTKTVRKIGFKDIKIEGGILRKEILDLFLKWKSL